MDDEPWWFWILILIVCLGFSLWQFVEVKKYFPEMSYIEYFLVRDKLVITPDK